MIVYYSLIDIGNSSYYLVVSDKKYRYKKLVKYTTQKVIHLNMVEKLLDYNILAITFDSEMLIPVSDIIFLADNEFLDHRWVQ